MSLTRTYLQHSLKDGYTVRWPDGAMPIQVFIAPFTWYEASKQAEASLYRQMILEAMAGWREATNNLVRFNIVDNVNASQIDFKWRRVDRRSLGHCRYEYDGNMRLFSAEISIGISDGYVSAEYQKADEVRHTIIHELGHALGLLDHSDGPEDIMYVPHQYGIFGLSERDKETMRWLYQLPQAFDYRVSAKKYGLPATADINDVINILDARMKGEEPDEKVADFAPSVANVKKDREVDEAKLMEHHDILSQMGRFHLTTQNITIGQQKQADLRRAIASKMTEKMILENPPES